MALGVAERAELVGIIDGAIPDREDFQRFVESALGKTLDEIAPECRGSELVASCHAVGRIAELVAALSNRIPGDVRIRKLALEIEVARYSGDAYQALVGTNRSLLDRATLSENWMHAEWCVCRIGLGSQGKGTGFLVGPDLVLTAHHVVSELLEGEAPKEWTFRFDYRNGVQSTEVRLVDEHWLVDMSPHTDDGLDFALLRIASRMGDGRAPGAAEARGWLTLASELLDVTRPTMVSILQHPADSAVRLAASMNEKLEFQAPLLCYTVPTQKGSSGAPVLDGSFLVIALHQGVLDGGEKNKGIAAHLIKAREAVSSSLPSPFVRAATPQIVRQRPERAVRAIRRIELARERAEWSSTAAGTASGVAVTAYFIAKYALGISVPGMAAFSLFIVGLGVSITMARTRERRFADILDEAERLWIDTVDAGRSDAAYVARCLELAEKAGDEEGVSRQSKDEHGT